jgi:hypothetical protein
VDRHANHSGRTAEEPLPRVVGDHDGARFLLLDDVVEVLETEGTAEERRHADDRQAVDVDRHLRHTAGFSRSGQRHGHAATLKEPD